MTSLVVGQLHETLLYLRGDVEAVGAVADDPPVLRAVHRLPAHKVKYF